jgi:hypothetical protein
MPFVHALETVETTIREPSLELVILQMFDLKKNQHGSFHLFGKDKDTFIIVFYVQSHNGYFVTGFFANDRECYVVVDRSLPDDAVQVWIDTDLRTVPKNALLEEANAIKAVTTYYHHGTRNDELGWILDEELLKYKK